MNNALIEILNGYKSLAATKKAELDAAQAAYDAVVDALRKSKEVLWEIEATQSFEEFKVYNPAIPNARSHGWTKEQEREAMCSFGWNGILPAALAAKFQVSLTTVYAYTPTPALYSTWDDDHTEIVFKRAVIKKLTEAATK